MHSRPLLKHRAQDSRQRILLALSKLGLNPMQKNSGNTLGLFLIRRTSLPYPILRDLDQPEAQNDHVQERLTNS